MTNLKPVYNAPKPIFNALKFIFNASKLVFRFKTKTKVNYLDIVFWSKLFLYTFMFFLYVNYWLRAIKMKF